MSLTPIDGNVLWIVEPNPVWVQTQQVCGADQPWTHEYLNDKEAAEAKRDEYVAEGISVQIYREQVMRYRAPWSWTNARTGRQIGNAIINP